ncbi:hypothetical protein AB0C70_24970 [Streptomyces sp. NPDC048564]|uniref:hypothetical protein n=1 Tax=Streptomyces sp. NPDC048564 TaxID=3155760 RepID=UPI0034312739
MAVNPALDRMHGIPAAQHLGRRYRETMKAAKFEVPEAAMQQVLTTGGTPGRPDHHGRQNPGGPGTPGRLVDFLVPA